MNKKPVSLILTLLNEGDEVRKVMDSILRQRRMPDEVVIVDGGSSDHTVELLSSYTTRLPLRIFVCPGANISQGRNFAIAHAEYDLIAVTDAGVQLQADWLERLVEPFERDTTQKPDFVSGFFLPDPQGLFEHALAMTTLPAREEMGKGRFMPSSRSVAFTRAIWARVGGYPEWMRWSEDVLFDLALINVGAKIVYQPDAIVWFRPRSSLSAFFRQYRNYAYGDGQALLWPKRQAIRYITYLILLPLLLWLLKKRAKVGAALLLAAGGIMFWTPFKRHWRSGFYRWLALPLIPIIRITGDIAKMWAFPQALPEGWHNAEETRRYLRGEQGLRGYRETNTVRQRPPLTPQPPRGRGGRTDNIK
jgi:glycosyltransferase involved in cell wall biosynthesis